MNNYEIMDKNTEKWWYAPKFTIIFELIGSDFPAT